MRLTNRLPPARLRRVLDRAIRGFARLLVHLFFREVSVTGLDDLPRDRPLLLIANHTNAVVDAVLLLALPVRNVRMLAKSTLFRHPLLGPFVALIGALPVYRRQDEDKDPAQNVHTFSAGCAALAAGDSIAVFPEGTSHSQPARLPLKSGAARLVLQAEARPEPTGVRVVPIGLHYEAKQDFRGRVHVHIGPALDPAPESARYVTEPRPAVRVLTERMAAGLDGVLSPADWTRPGPRVSRPLPRRVAERAVSLTGLALNWLPYSFPRWVCHRFAKRPDDPATYKLLAGLIAFPLAWAAECALAGAVGGPWLAAAVAVAAPASGYAALRIREAREGTTPAPM